MQAKKSSLWALDLFRGDLPLPPADITLDGDDFVPRFLSLNGPDPFKFFLRDVPCLKSAAISSNFGDGLMPANNMGLKLSLVRMAAALTGTLSNTAGSADFTVTGGALITEACPGMAVFFRDDSGVQRSAVIATITSDTAGTFTAVTKSAGAYTDDATGVTATPAVYVEELDTLVTPLWEQANEFRRRQGSEQLNPTRSTFADGRPRGRVRLDAPGDGDESSTLRGMRWESDDLSAMFTQDMKAGQIVRLGGRTLLVSAVTDQFHATISHPDPDTAPSVAGIPTALDGAEFEQVDDHFEILVEMDPDDQVFKTIAIDPAFSGSTMWIHALVEIEHRFFEVNRAN